MTAGLTLPYASSQTAARSSTKRPGLFVRIARAVHDAQMRSAERHIARMIQLQGGVLTDSIERRISNMTRHGQF